MSLKDHEIAMRQELLQNRRLSPAVRSALQSMICVVQIFSKAEENRRQKMCIEQQKAERKWVEEALLEEAQIELARAELQRAEKKRVEQIRAEMERVELERVEVEWEEETLAYQEWAEQCFAVSVV